MNKEKREAMFTKIAKSKFFLYSALFAFVFELFTVCIAFATYGHAGPEGSWAFLGWISLLLNFFGVAFAAFLDSVFFKQYNSLTIFAVCVFIAQFSLICFIAYIIKYFSLRKEKFSRDH